jgi:hypothetical protein
MELSRKADMSVRLKTQASSVAFPSSSIYLLLKAALGSQLFKNAIASVMECPISCGKVVLAGVEEVCMGNRRVEGTFKS